VTQRVLGLLAPAITPCLNLGAVDKDGAQPSEPLSSEAMSRIQLTLVLALVFVLGAAFAVLRHDWLDAGLAVAVVALALIAAYRRRGRSNG